MPLRSALNSFLSANAGISALREIFNDLNLRTDRSLAVATRSLTRALLSPPSPLAKAVLVGGSTLILKSTRSINGPDNRFK
ncbi:unannotated protein [freshwater metagenome]|uniref:Unannotated protein n=1 Tax=freshwater metagenome TaxID=449393 RepID=A0A6J6GDD4_9ZZZZ